MNTYRLYEHTARFFVLRDPNRRGIDGKPSPISEVMYQPDPTKPAQEFAHIWQIRGWEPEDEGKWTFNRSDVCIANSWRPAIYKHETLQGMLDHLEQTFVEGVPANVPKSD